ncbi:hypothetical protein OSTOST_14479, partial [Ostertagia ostertagi]
MFKDDALINNFGGNGIFLVSKIVNLLAALEFVQKEIQCFGGDPNNVAVMGHSSGAVAAAQFSFSKQIDPHS